jgi:hypothetical protein
VLALARRSVVPFESGQAHRLCALATSNCNGLELRQKDEHKPEIAQFGRRADYGFDAAETGLPVVYPS